jgi:uncharacterized protein (UPF0548 family)
VIRLQRPSPDQTADLLRGCDAPFSYPEVGATADGDALGRLERHYYVDRHRIALGTGRALFERARTALFAWRHFEIPWLALEGAAAPAAPGQVVATLARVAGLWFWNPCRVVYAEEAAFAYGTLPGHVERGEERFAVRYDSVSEQVAYEITAFSRPAALVAKLGLPWARRTQKRFAAASGEAIRRALRAGAD